jgi:hypothetical protein
VWALRSGCGSLVELDASNDDHRHQHLVERVRAGFDHDIDK